MLLFTLAVQFQTWSFRVFAEFTVAIVVSVLFCTVVFPELKTVELLYQYHSTVRFAVWLSAAVMLQVRFCVAFGRSGDALSMIDGVSARMFTVKLLLFVDW